MLGLFGLLGGKGGIVQLQVVSILHFLPSCWIPCSFFVELHFVDKLVGSRIVFIYKKLLYSHAVLR